MCHDDGGLAGSRADAIVACGDFTRASATPIQAPRRSIGAAGFSCRDSSTRTFIFLRLRVIGGLGRSLLDWLDAVALPEEARMADSRYAAATPRAVSCRRWRRTAPPRRWSSARISRRRQPRCSKRPRQRACGSSAGLVLSDRLLRPELHVTPQTRRIATAPTLIERFHKRGRLLYAVTPRFALSTSEAMLEVCQTLCRSIRDVRLQTHINENTSGDRRGCDGCSRGQPTIWRLRALRVERRSAP